MNLEIILPAIGLITVVTNIVVQVLKKATWEKLPTNIVVLAVAQILTLVSGGAYAHYNNITLNGFLVSGAIVIGFLVAYAAMFGYDKLKEVLNFDRISDQK